VTIDGLNTGGNSLTIENSNIGTTASPASTIRFINDATKHTIQNCTIKGASNGATTSGAIFFAGGSSTGNDGNIISGNTITSSTSAPAVVTGSITTTVLDCYCGNIGYIRCRTGNIGNGNYSRYSHNCFSNRNWWNRYI
jgi:hypothetical protein